MTAVMRAAPRPSGTRTLRAALVRDGRIVDERVIPLGEHLTVGPTERSTFVVAGLAGSARLLEWSRAGYRLRLGPGMSGRVSLAGQVSELRGGREEAPIALDEDARGKVVLGDAFLLFHFVEPHVAQAQPQLPLAVRQGVFDGLDWKTTFIAAFSFLFHFGVVGAAYSDFADGVIPDDGARIVRALDIIRDLPPSPPVTEHPVADADAKLTPTHPVDGPAQPSKAGGVGRPGPAHRGPAKLTDEGAASIARALAEESGMMLLAIGGAGNRGATDNVLNHGSDMPSGLLDGAAANANGARMGGTQGLNLGTGSTAMRPGQRGGGLGFGDGTRDVSVADKVGTDNGPKKPIPVTQVLPPDMSVCEVPGAARVVSSLRGMLRACYQHEIDADPGAKGSVRVTATIGPNGEVRSAQAAPSGLSSNMAACVSRVVRGAQFEQPACGTAVVAIPMSFYSQ